MLAHSAWDFYFERTQREFLLEQLRLHKSSPAEEVCYLDRYGQPLHLLVSSSLVSSSDGRLDLILSTAIEIAQDSNPHLVSPELSASTVEEQGSEWDRTANVSQKLTRLLQRATQLLQEDNLPKMGKAEIREALLVLEEIKMLMSELEILRLPPM